MSYNILITDISYLLQSMVDIPDFAKIYICLDITPLFPFYSEILIMNLSAKCVFYLCSYLYVIDLLIICNELNNNAIGVFLYIQSVLILTNENIFNLSQLSTRYP